MTDVHLILAAIDASGLSARRFAERVMTRDERTIRRWSAGDVPIPETARSRLAWFVALSDSKRRRLIELLDE